LKKLPYIPCLNPFQYHLQEIHRKDSRTAVLVETGHQRDTAYVPSSSHANPNTLD